MCVVRVEPDIAKGTSLAQEVPALIQFDLDLREPLTIGLGKFPSLVQSLFLCDKALNIIEDRLIPDLFLHEGLLSRGYDRNGHDFMVRPTETGVNRSSDQHDVPSEQEIGGILNFAPRGGPAHSSLPLPDQSIAFKGGTSLTQRNRISRCFRYLKIL